MSLYERIDHDVSSKPRETFEFLLVYAVCFGAMLIPASIRHASRWIDGDRHGSGRSIVDDARAMAAICAAASFMGM